MEFKNFLHTFTGRLITTLQMIRKPNLLVSLMVVFSLTMTSCVEEFQIEDKDFESKLVINALFENGSAWSVDVSNSSDIFNPETKNEKITFAKVEIYDQKDEFLYELFHEGDGKYSREDYGPSPKRGYSIKVSAIGYHPVTAKSFVPEKSTLLINNFSIIHSDKHDDVEVDFEIQDRSQLESYYIWEIVSIDGEDGGTNNSSNQLSETWINELRNNPNKLVNTDREFLGNGSFGDGTYKGTYNSNEGNRRIGYINNASSGIASSSDPEEEIISLVKVDPSNGIPHEVVTHLDEHEEDDIDNDEGTDKVVFKYELRVMTISKELYTYYSSLEEYYQNGGNNHSNQNPFKLYTNVTNGAGIFAGLSESVIQF